ncbi:hypothetical protein AAX30_01424 [Arcobacter porcinus]|nr:hypothetical protein [Arcobacter porcinus]OCL86699.1 hypothetical protein AAX30_01424 [Arcobacter porcinus]
MISVFIADIWLVSFSFSLTIGFIVSKSVSFDSLSVLLFLFANREIVYSSLLSVLVFLIVIDLINALTNNGFMTHTLKLSSNKNESKFKWYIPVASMHIKISSLEKEDKTCYLNW